MVIPCAFGAAVVIVRRHPEIRMTPAVTIAAFLQAAFAQFFAAPFAVSDHDMVLLAAFGIGQLALGLILFVNGARLLPAAETALLALLESILAPLWVWLFVGEDPGLYAVAGGSVVLAALAIHSLLDLRAPARLVPPVA
jgi:drug/metabolite transporter (DMT)-like permease